jgi:hypothetical protein
MSKWLILLVLSGSIYLLFIYPEYAKKYSYLLTLNRKDKDDLPRNFHTTPFHSSGSAQFSEKELKNMLAQIPSDQVKIVDLRQEPHGFLNGDAVSWYREHNWGDIGKSTEKILSNEKQLIDRLGRQFWALVYHDRLFPVPYRVKTARSEQELTQLMRIGYLRFPLTDHRRPTDSDVDAFIQLMLKLPANIWLHFHCSAGKGRTTTFLAMQDMMLNAHEDSLETIVKRQKDLGGIDLFHVSQDSQNEWKRPYIETRVGFIRQFYEYCKDEPDFDVLWSEWIEKNGKSPYNPTT